MKDVVEIELVDNAIVIRPASELRKGWFDKAISDEHVLDSIPLEEGISDWEWE